jgi:ribonuclease R
MLPVRRLRGDWWELNEQGTMLWARAPVASSGSATPVRVAVRQVDAPRGRVDLDLVGIPES